MKVLDGMRVEGAASGQEEEEVEEEGFYNSEHVFEDIIC